MAEVGGSDRNGGVGVSWVLLDDDFPNHPKVLKAGKAAAYAFVVALCYCRKYHTGGYLPMDAYGRVGATVTVIDALVTTGLWHAFEGGMQVNGYDGLYADDEDKTKKATTTQQRRDAGRLGGLARAAAQADAPLVNFGSALPSKRPSDLPSEEGTVRIFSDHLLEKKKRAADFATFWANYPRKDGKRAALSQWEQIKPDDAQQLIIAADLDRRKRSPSWQKDGGQFVPHAKTYLHQRRWEDGFEEPLLQAVGGRTGAPPKGKYDGIEES